MGFPPGQTECPTPSRFWEVVLGGNWTPGEMGHLDLCPKCQSMISRLGEIAGHGNGEKNLVSDSLIQVREPLEFTAEMRTETRPQDSTGLSRLHTGMEWSIATHRVVRSQTEDIGETLPPSSLAPHSTYWPSRVGFGSGELPGKLGRYSLLRLLGSGGMGEVFEAFDEELARRVALKVSPAFNGRSDSSRLDRFFREARIVAALHHPAILPIYEVGQVGGTIYIASQLVEGTSLKERMSEGPLPWQEAATLIARICEGVQAVHDAHIIHRDIKLSNILIDGAGRPYLCDFGLARMCRCDEEASITCDGAIMGTPAYMAPEQVRGEIPLQGPATDIYGLGATLYALLTGRPPHQASGTMELFEQITSGDLRPPRMLNPAVPRDLDTICMKALRRDPSERYATALAMEHDLRRLLAGEPVLAGRTRAWRKGFRRVTRGRALFVLLLISLFYNVVFLGSRRDDVRQVDPSPVQSAPHFPDAVAAEARGKADVVLRQTIASTARASCDRILDETERWLRSHPDDPTARLAAARALLSLGHIHGTTGHSREAIPLYRRALDLLTTLAEQHPSQALYGIERDETGTVLAAALCAAGRSEEGGDPKKPSHP